MSDITELVKRLRDYAQCTETDIDEAADALEAQAKEIAEFEGFGADECRRDGCQHESWRAHYKALEKRIAELEEENKKLRGLLKPFAAVKERDIELWYGLDPDPFVPDDAALNSINNSPTVGDLRAARAALKGEK